MRDTDTRSAFSRFAGAIALMLALCAVDVLAADAEIISVAGKGDKRDTAQADWIPAFPKQTVKPGGFVRTRELSQMALLLPDRTQLRLNQNSQMQIKSVADAAEWSQNAVKLNAGRAWSQARPPASAAAAGAGAAPARISMETPSATLSIRGTDWEVEVGPDGRTQLVVLSGTVDMANEQGMMKVGAGESAVAEIGKAPVKLLLSNPASRVQWVTSWQVQPKRWVPQPGPALAPVITLLEAGDYAAAMQGLERIPASAERNLLSADLAMMSGDILRATGLLTPYAGNGKGNPRASALLARVYLARGDADAAAALLSGARAAHPRDVEIWLATAELAMFQGDAKAARVALTTSLDLDPGNPDAWFARGSIETEYENVPAARGALDAALAARPGFPNALAQRGTLETFADDFATARAYYEQALTAAPDDYIALTGRGILKLKTGDSNGALEDFMRAGVIEPRYGRAWLYSAAAFYQLGETKHAQEALHKAADLDPHDPLPYIMLGLIATDQLDLGKAVEAARDAQERMPYLKSLNQVLTNQKGNANVGNALADYGMDEWARQYATSGYSPWWAGSHLFMSDLYVSGYNKNSELYQGFITDPTVFGASQRKSSLVPTPGHHGRVDLYMEQADWRQNALVGTANGLVVTPTPLAYFFSGDFSKGDSRRVGDSADGTNYTLGLGWRPHYALDVFLFGTDTRIRGDLKSPVLPKDTISIDDSRFDLGFNVKLDFNNQLWLKYGSGRESALVKGSVALAPFGVVPLEHFHSRVSQSDSQLRHAFSPIEGTWLSWGYEDSEQEKPANFDVRLTPAVQLSIYEISKLRSRDAYVVARAPLTETLRGEVGAFDQRTHFSQRSEVLVNGAFLVPPTSISRDFSETNWRGGLQWQFAPQSTVTAVSQQWRRPADVGSLAPVDTLGIAVNDQLTTNGGLYRRNRLQVDYEAGAATFVQGFADHEVVKNVSSPLTVVVPDLQLTQLENLRNRTDVFTVQPEFEEAPVFLEGRVNSYGFALNHMISREQTIAVRYRHADAEQTGVRSGLQIPYLPRDYFRIASQWSLPERWLLGAMGTWRSERFREERNIDAQRIDAGWIFRLTAYWESADKRWITQAILDNLRYNRNSSDPQKSQVILRASYLF
jgi:tetratricopeptide (TPR) repeat protein